MAEQRESAVLFAELLGAAELYGRADDTVAHEAIAQCAGRLGRAAGSDARVVKTLGARLMLVATDADAAARAAVSMQTEARQFAAAGAPGLTLGVGFHCGPLIREEDGDLFGDAVNLAARLVEQAASGQVLLAAETAGALSPPYRRLMRQLYSIPVKGRAEEVTLCELVWRIDEAGATFLPFAPPKLGRARLTLKYRGGRVVLETGAAPLSIGREEDCGLVLAETEEASRHHCTIQQRGDHFVLADRSTNGTFVTVEGEGEIRLKREEFTLRKRGWLSFGSSRADGAESAEFSCD